MESSDHEERKTGSGDAVRSSRIQRF